MKSFMIRIHGLECGCSRKRENGLKNGNSLNNNENRKRINRVRLREHPLIYHRFKYRGKHQDHDRVAVDRVLPIAVYVAVMMKIILIDINSERLAIRGMLVCMWMDVKYAVFRFIHCTTFRIAGCMNGTEYAVIGGSLNKRNFKKAKLDIKFKQT